MIRKETIRLPPCRNLTREETVMSQLYDCRDAFAAALEDIASRSRLKLETADDELANRPIDLKGAR